MRGPSPSHDDCRHYSVHGVCRLTVRSQVRSAGLSHLDAQFRAFRVVALEGPPDIVVDIEPATGWDLYRQTRTPFDVGENHVSWRTGFKLGRWRARVDGLAGGPLRVTFAGNPFSYRYLFFHVLEPLVDYHLCLNGMVLLHASAVGTGASALAFSSLSGVGKTSLAIQLLSMGAKQFLGDEFVIVSADGTIRSFPLPLSLFHRNLVATPSLRPRLTTGVLAGLQASRMLAVLTRTFIRPRVPIVVGQIFPGVGVPHQLPIGALCYLVATGGDHVSLRSTPRVAHIVERLIENNRFEFRFFRRALDAFAAAHPTSPAASHDERCADVLGQALARSSCFEVGVPRRRPLDAAPSSVALRRVMAGASV